MFRKSDPNDKKKDLLLGLIWNYGSIVILSLSGFLFNILIMIFYDASVLGVFNQAYAWYIVLSQIAVFGIQASVTKYAAEFVREKDKIKTVLASALAGITITSAAAMVLSEIAAGFFFSDRPELLYSVRIVILALGFFSANKVVLGCLNGISHMKAYAVFQSLRYICIAASIWVLAVLGVQGKFLTFCFLIAEGVVLLSSILYLMGKNLLKPVFDQHMLLRHLKFGFRIIPSNLVLELNTKVDVLCLGFLLKDDSVIGIYSFAVLFAEGFYQIYVVIRRSINPMITEKFMEFKLKEFIVDINIKLKKYLLIFSSLAGFGLLAGYLILCMLMQKKEYIEGIVPLMVIVFSIMLNSRFIIFGNLFAQIGKPACESAINVIVVGINIIGNLLLISLWGTIGAAIATAISYFGYSILMKKFLYKNIQVKL